MIDYRWLQIQGETQIWLVTIWNSFIFQKYTYIQEISKSKIFSWVKTCGFPKTLNWMKVKRVDSVSTFNIYFYIKV